MSDILIVFFFNLNKKRNENFINTNNIYYNDNIKDKTEEGINLDYQNALVFKEIYYFPLYSKRENN